jgi:GH25 family lysozyme M1 (1,4-beta-N-acetylmuramidase)
MGMMNGIDISNWQRGLSIAEIKADFVIIKATEGVGFTDQSFKNFIEQALVLGKRIGVYHFARPYAQNFNTPTATPSQVKFASESGIKAVLY